MDTANKDTAVQSSEKTEDNKGTSAIVGTGTEDVKTGPEALPGKATELSPAPKTVMGFDLLIIKTVILSLIISCSVVFAYDRYFAQKVDMSSISASIPKIVKADFDVYMQKQVDLLKSGKIDEKQFLASIDAYNKKVETLPKNYIVFLMSKGELFIRNAEVFNP